MKTLLVGFLDLLMSVVFFPIVVRDYLHAKTAEARAQEILHSAQTAGVLWAMGADHRPLARVIVGKLQACYGVQPSALNRGELVPMQRTPEDDAG